MFACAFHMLLLSTGLLELHSYGCDVLSARYLVQNMLYLDCTSCTSLFMSTPRICSLTADLGQSEGATNEHTVLGVLGILALENGIGSQPLWLCQEGVRADLCYKLPSIREQITSLGGEREGHRAISREHCGYFY